MTSSFEPENRKAKEEEREIKRESAQSYHPGTDKYTL